MGYLLRSNGFKLFNLNVNGLFNQIKRRRLALFLSKAQVKVVCLQETHLRESEEHYRRGMFKGLIYHAPTPTVKK